MKKLTTLILLLLAASVNFAQNSKPTKEETVQFIKSELENKKITYSYYQREHSGGNEITDMFYTYTNFNINSCILNYKTVWKNIRILNEVESLNNTSQSDNSINFKLVEAINVKILGGINLDNISFVFKQKNVDGSYLKEIEILIGQFPHNTDAFSLKIYKAFQHLRKLCDAPEPISFD